MSNNSNRPNNHFIKDATSPYTFNYMQYGVLKSITVNQSNREETWPGGALWDIGVLMAKLVVMMQSPSSCHAPIPTPHNGPSNSKSKSNKPNSPFSKYLFPSPPKRILAPGIWGPSTSFSQKRILELGCGVGLTGLVASALGARAVILSDLQDVVEHITQPNVGLFQKEWNKNGGSGNSSQKVEAKTLCWGNSQDEEKVRILLDTMAPPYCSTTSTGRKKKGKSKTSNTTKIKRDGIPDIILIGDVAYQHKPGAQSHFDILLSTTKQFIDNETLLIFGTRMRMPASKDLLLMFREELEEIVDPPIQAHEIDPAFNAQSMGGRKHNITIHIMRRKKKLVRIKNENEIPL